MPPKKKAAAVVVSSDSEVEIVPKKKISAKAKAKPVGANPFAIAVGKKKANNPFTAAASATSKASATKKPTKTKKAEALRVESDDDDTYKPSPVKLNRKKRSDDASAFFSDNSDSDFDPGTEKAESSEEEAAPIKRRSTRNTPVKTVSKHFVEPKKSRPQSTVNPEDFFGSKPVERGSKVKSAHKSAQKGGKSKTDSTKAEFDSEKAKVEAEMIDLDGDDDAEVIAPKRKRAKSPTPPVSVAPAPAKRAKKAGALAGKTYVITGKMNTFSSTSDIRDLVEEKDGRLLADTMDNFAVARYCVVGTDPDTAMVKVAEEAQVEVIDEFVLCKQLAMPSQANKARRMVKEHNKEREKAEKASRKMKVDKPAKPAAVDTMDVDEPEPPKKSGYQVMMAREPPNALGSRAIPALKTGCFSGLTFCFSGVLDTISKLDYTELVTSHGGRVTGSVSGKTSYLVSGRDGGETKVAKAKEVGCKVIDEDGFYALLDTHMSKDQSNAKPAHVLTEEENEAKAASKQSHFRAMMNREGPKALGTRDIPTCKDMCFVDTTFVFSGIMDTISSDDAKELVKQYGGRVTTGVSKKTSYLVCGRDRGETKYAKAVSVNVPVLDEDGFYALLEKHTVKEGEDTVESPAAPSPAKPAVKKVKTDDSWMPQRKKTTPATPQQNSSAGALKKGDKPMKSDPASTSRSSGGKASPALLWTDKYKPTTVKDIIGNQTNIEKLTHWLQNWDNRHIKGMKVAPLKSSGRGNKADDSDKKAVLLTGPPGIGKTTMATLVAKSLGFEPIEMNASDVRSKSSLKEVVREILSSKTISQFYGTATKAKATKHLLIMDEVDGMSAGDRGGVTELNQLIKITKVPIICMCNDNGTQKMRSLTPNCYDLKITRPTAMQIKGKFMSICFKEGLKIEPNALEELITSTQNDLRQILNQLSVWSLDNEKITYNSAKEGIRKAHKDTVTSMNAFDCVRKVYNPEEARKMTIDDRLRHFFVDDIIPLMSQENYLAHEPQLAGTGVNGLKEQEAKAMYLASLAADSFSDSDLIDGCKRTNNAWGLMPAHGIASFVRPAYIMKGQLKSTGFGWPRISFPQWLGNYSKTGKYARQLRELQVHTRLHGYSDAAELNKWYVPALSQAITTPLVNEGTDGVEHVVDIMKEYTLLREDWDNIQDLCTFKGITQPPKIETKAKSAFTRAYKNAGILLPYAERLDKPRRTAASNGSAGAEALVGGDEGGIAQDVVELDDEEDDDDSVVLKQKKPSAKGKGKATAKKPVAKKGKGKL